MTVLPVGQVSPPELAAVANREHALVCEAGTSLVEHAIRAGEALTAAKAGLAHGEWLPWLEANFRGSRQTADNYRRLAANCQHVGNLEEPTLRKALEAIAGANPAPSQPRSTPVVERDATPADLVDQEIFSEGAHAICPTCGGTGVVPVEAIGGVTK